MASSSTLAGAAQRTPLLLMGSRAEPGSERGTWCPGAVPSASDPGLVDRARTARERLGDDVIVLGHHYQRDEVIAFADARGDSFKLARLAADNGAPTIVFCGVHFMAETADVLTPDSTRVMLPDLAAGCSMADMADIVQVETAWADLAEVGARRVVPLTYMNSSAAIKAFTGREGGAVCTSSNAERALRWAFERGDQVLFLPDQHLGRNTAVRNMGMSLDDCVVYDPHLPGGGVDPARLATAPMILWKGHCSVHGTFLPRHVREARERIPDVTVLVHPECRYEVVEQADLVGSTEFIIRTIAEAPTGSAWVVGTELNLVGRLAQEHPDKQVSFLDDKVCFCATMNRIDLPHLVWALETLVGESPVGEPPVGGQLTNQIRVDPDTRRWALVALERMLSLPGV